nr:hypothetical protein [Nanoarchaeum sp.]
NGDGCSSTCQTEIPICSLTSASWSTTQVVNNTQVTLTVNGENCDVETINFRILEDDGIAGTSDVTSQLRSPPTSTTFVSGVAIRTWNAEWLQDSGVFTDDNPEFVFEAVLASDNSETVQSDILIVTPSVVIPSGSPTINSVSDNTLDNGQSITISGSDFGIKNPVAPIRWDAVDNQYSLTSLDNLTSVPTGGSYYWTANGDTGLGSEDKVVFYNGVESRVNNNWVYHILGETNKGKGFLIGPDNNLPSGSDFYVSFWHKVDGLTLDQASTKIIRVWSDPSGNTGRLSWTYDQWTLYDTFDASCGVSAQTPWITQDLPASTTDYHHFEVLFEFNQTETCGEEYKNSLYLDRNPITATMSIMPGYIFEAGRRAVSTNGAYDTVERIGTDVSNIDLVEPTNTWFDDIYIDNTQARIVIGDSQDFSEVNHFEIQIPHTTWNGNTIQFTANKGSFGTEQLYLFVIDENGVVSNEFPITFTGTAAVCGDGSITGSEVCDGSNLNDQTCVLQGFDSGTLSCNNDCLSFNTANCVNQECSINADCEDGNVCTTNTCNTGSCAVSYNTLSCNDNSVCTANDVCSLGSCSGTTISSCINSDGCCPGSCTNENDNDCSATGDEVFYLPYDSNLNDVIIPQTGSCASCPTQTAGQVNNAYDFNGVSNFVEYGDILNLQFPVTIAAWVYPESNAKNPIFFSDGGSSVNHKGYWLYHSRDGINGQLELAYGADSGPNSADRRSYVTSSNALPLNQWSHVVGIINAANDMKIYVNGAEVAGILEGADVVYQNTVGPVTVGRRTTSTVGVYNYFNGKIDEVKVFNKALTVVEIQALMGVTPECTINSDCNALTYSNPVTQCNLTSGNIPTFFTEYICSNYECVLSGNDIINSVQDCSAGCVIYNDNVTDRDPCYELSQTTCPQNNYPVASCSGSSYVTYACSGNDAVQTSVNCDNSDGWYDTGLTRVVDISQCTEQEQKQQIYTDFSCSVSGCVNTTSTTQWINSGAVRNKAEGLTCDDGLYCSVNDACSVGNCTGVARPVDDGVSCTTDSCNEATNTVIHTPVNSLCSDSLWCTGTETCSATLGCQAGTPINVNDGITCTTDSCNEANDTVIHTPVNSLCSDSSYCNGDETCSAALGCQAGSAIICADAFSCTADSCNEVNDNCQYIPTDSLCALGQVCNINYFPPSTGGCGVITTCTGQPNGVSCNDGVFCNGIDQCNNQVCTNVGPSLNVDDGVACTTDSCSESTDTIIHTPTNSLCNDEFYCNGVESCNYLGCQMGENILCNDNDFNTIDSCSEELDLCVYNPVSNVTSQTISLSSGWNLVTLNIYSNADSSDFGSMIVMKYENNDWVMDFEGMNAFELVPLEGYYVYSTQDDSVVFSGESLSSGYRYSLVNGTWNLFSVHSSGSYSSLYSDNAYSLFSATASGTNQIGLDDNLVPGSLYWANLRGPEYSLPQSEAEESTIVTVFKAIFRSIVGYTVRDFD